MPDVNPFASYTSIFMAIAIIAFGLGIAIIGILNMLKNESIGPTSTTIGPDGVAVKSANPGFYIFFGGLAVALITYQIFSKGAVGAKGTAGSSAGSGIFVQTAHAKNHRPVKKLPFVAGWVYLGPGGNQKEWRFVFLGRSLRYAKASTGRSIIRAKKAMPIREKPFGALTGTILQVLSPPTNIIGTFPANQCARVMSNKSVGFNKIWLKIAPLPRCP